MSICNMLIHMDTRVAAVTSNKIYLFLNGHHETYSTSRGCACIRICLDELDMNPGQPMVTSNEIWNYLGIQQEAYSTSIGMYIQVQYHVDTRE